jgi:AcrR family transcriptional regulator
MQLTRKRIIATAMELIERDGAEAVSMQRLATELGCSVMSLYSHFPSKPALLDGVADAVMSGIEIVPAAGDCWQQQLRPKPRRSGRSRELIRGAPWSSPAGHRHRLASSGRWKAPCPRCARPDSVRRRPCGSSGHWSRTSWARCCARLAWRPGFATPTTVGRIVRACLPPTSHSCRS